MSDIYKIDSHKLIYHPKRVAEWIDGYGDWEKEKNIYPIYVEISPNGACNHRCTFCAIDYIGYQNIKPETELLKNRIAEMGELGIKSIMSAGEGEPLLNRDLAEIVKHTKKSGIDVSITSNFSVANSESINKILEFASWIKISINAGSAKTYSEVHQTKESDFDKVIENLKLAVEIKKQNNFNCTIGAQMLLLPENSEEAFMLAEKMRDIGVDYTVIKPYSQHLFSETKKYKDLTYQDLLHLEDRLAYLNNESYSVIFRANTMKKIVDSSPKYELCYSTPYLWAYIMADGAVYGCSAFLMQKKFCYGNINTQTFKEIWQSEERKEGVTFVREKLNISTCRTNCRMDSVNRYLWELKHPSAHVNFI